LRARLVRAGIPAVEVETARLERISMEPVHLLAAPRMPAHAGAPAAPGSGAADRYRALNPQIAGDRLGVRLV
jgi:hypothetical protein